MHVIKSKSFKSAYLCLSFEFFFFFSFWPMYSNNYANSTSKSLTTYDYDARSANGDAKRFVREHANDSIYLLCVKVAPLQIDNGTRVMPHKSFGIHSKFTDDKSRVAAMKVPVEIFFCYAIQNVRI